jgi:phosphate uptake regulator
MNQRKLIKLGNSSYAIALPKDWIKKSGLNKGDNVYIIPNSNGELIVQPDFKETSNKGFEIMLDLANKTDKESEREISSSYIRGYDTIKIKGLSSQKKKYVESLLKNLISLEIIDKEKDTLIAKDFFDLKGADINKFLRRLDNILRGIFEEVETVIEKQAASENKINEIYSLDWEINRLYFLIYRMFIKGLNNPSVLNVLKTDNLSLLNNWQIAVKIGELGDEVKGICKLVDKKISPKERNRLLTLYKELNKTYIDLISSHYTQDEKKIKEISQYRYSLLKKSEELTESKNSSVSKIGDKYKHIVSLIHELSKLNLYTLIENE